MARTRSSNHLGRLSLVVAAVAAYIGMTAPPAAAVKTVTWGGCTVTVTAPATHFYSTIANYAGQVRGGGGCGNVIVRVCFDYHILPNNSSTWTGWTLAQKGSFSYHYHGCSSDLGLPKGELAQSIWALGTAAPFECSDFRAVESRTSIWFIGPSGNESAIMRGDYKARMYC